MKIAIALALVIASVSVAAALYSEQSRGSDLSVNEPSGALQPGQLEEQAEVDDSGPVEPFDLDAE